MGLDMIYVRCDERLIERAGDDRAFAEQLMHGAGGAAEDIDVGRAEDELYQLLGPTLGPTGQPYLDFSRAHADHDWAGLALSGDAWLHGGIDTGYGTPRFLRPAAVRAIAQAFEALTEAAFGERAAAAIAAGELRREHLAPIYARLRRFYLDAARDGHAVIVTPT